MLCQACANGHTIVAQHMCAIASATLLSTSCATSLPSNFSTAPSISVCILFKNQYATTLQDLMPKTQCQLGHLLGNNEQKDIHVKLFMYILNYL